MGKNTALLALEKARGLSPKQVALMQRISGNAVNHAYGEEALRRRYVDNRYVAAAAVFARLANATENFSTTEITSENWIDAGFMALQLGKCPDLDIETTFEELLEATQ